MLYTMYIRSIEFSDIFMGTYLQAQNNISGYSSKLIS